MANPRVLDKFRIDELSGVDFPAQKGARAVLIKRDFSADQRRQAADKGEALPDGSFPIASVKDLENAIHDIGRAKDQAKAKAHIIARAKALGATSQLPDGWLSKADPGNSMEDTMSAELKKALGLADSATDADITKAVTETAERLATLEKANTALEALAKMSDKHKAFADKSEMTAEQKSAFAGKTPEERDAHMSNNPVEKALPAEIQKRLEEAEALQKRVNTLEEQNALAVFSKRAVEIGLPEADGVTLMKAAKGDAEAVKKLEDAIKALTAQVKEAGLFKEFGAANGPDATSPTAQVDAVVGQMQKAEPTLSRAQAIAKLAKSPEHAAIWKAYKEATPRAA